MDLKQRKLNKSEWDSIEISVSKPEIDILDMIIKGYHDVNIRINNNNSLLTFLKIEYSEKMEDYLFNKYMRVASDRIEKDLKKCDPEYKNMNRRFYLSLLVITGCFATLLLSGCKDKGSFKILADLLSANF